MLQLNDFQIHDDSAASHQGFNDSRLRVAIENGEGLTSVFQPMVDRSHQLVGLEALTRMSIDGAAVLPDTLFPAARRMGLLPKLGANVTARAIREFAAWSSSCNSTARLSLNATAEELAIDEACNALLSMLHAHGVDPVRVTLEISEASPLPPSGKAIDHIHELARAGVRISLDDFGKGNNGLASLRWIPAQQLKIDRHFIATLQDDDPLVRGMIRTAHDMGIQVVAEGIETERQAELLLSFNCDLLQGFYFGRPQALRAGEPSSLTFA